MGVGAALRSGATPSPYGPLFLMVARGVAVFVNDQVFLAAHAVMTRGIDRGVGSVDP